MSSPTESTIASRHSAKSTEAKTEPRAIRIDRKGTNQFSANRMEQKIYRLFSAVNVDEGFSTHFTISTSQRGEA
jgi:hypothetical protein